MILTHVGTEGRLLETAGSREGELNQPAVTIAIQLSDSDSTLLRYCEATKETPLHREYKPYKEFERPWSTQHGAAGRAAF